ncbi:oligopeptide ABC transporter permease [Lactobacillus delbrueckii subsp. bulgaricus]|uniref:oligopeptide ABC transporter permease n=1 Tax=Lactobacillus delbrueckii TaxID=1584 RepID=UPI001BFFAF5D|nr:oligopeptide ABC transporter permease [Lactobacillus delbrueckii]MBT8801603.1 peptide ABC transporter permease [Lactobacillus delbrueckii subsp. bulgaricus]MBT8814114.1 peptide ABC transporter permease [Lactobacillus delbrueckii subsp. bulgaricus]MBT8842554.1 peptide ABC transporter permease [Lactobacillus delbrueckii subsp. bulgaricus]MBT8894747.1 peptide ABC transporter permease [Lactobacillus delbrueckii subsp. bulgaricus]MBT8896300.1 peptide ABC transporter permease [Lactobacillus delbr
MWKTVLRRVLIMIPQLILLSIIVFMLAKMMPGDPFTGLINPNSSPKEIARLKQAYGLNDPVPVQYVRWIKNLLHGDFGQSYIQHVPVASLIADRAQNTFWLSLLSTIILYGIAIPMGISAGKHEGEWQDRAISIFNYVTYAIPGFVFYLLGLWLFGFTLGWFPISGTVAANASGFWGVFFSRLQHMILPAILFAIIATTGTVQYLRTGIIDNKVEDYVKTARSKGVPEKVVFNKHILRNSFLPIAAFMGNTITGLLGGSLIIETVFSFPGMGKLFLDSISQRDYTTLTALIMIYGTLTLLGNLLSDIIMSLVDPRIRVK